MVFLSSLTNNDMMKSISVLKRLYIVYRDMYIVLYREPFVARVTICNVNYLYYNVPCYNKYRDG